MEYRFTRAGIVRSCRRFRHTVVVLLAIAVSVSAPAEAQFWFGPSVGVESPVRSSETQDGPGRGFDFAFRVFKEKHIDLLVSGYVTGVVGGNDADPWAPLAVGARWCRQFGDIGDFLVSFGSLGLAAGHTIGYARAPVGYIQAEFGFDLAPRSSVSAALGVRDRVGIPVVQSAQAFLFLRLGRASP